MRSRKAERALIGLFEAERAAQNTSTIVYLAKALWQIRPDPRWLAAVAEVLASAEFDMRRMSAALALAIFCAPEAVRALVKALDDPAPLVRHHAARALLAIHGLSDEDAPARDSEHMTYRVMSDDAARSAEGKRDVVAAIAGQPISGP